MAGTIKLDPTDFSHSHAKCSKAASSVSNAKLSLPQMSGSASALLEYRRQTKDLEDLVKQYADQLKADEAVLKEVGDGIVDADKKAADNVKQIK